jgi:hypothetical protein
VVAAVRDGVVVSVTVKIFAVWNSSVSGLWWYLHNLHRKVKWHKTTHTGFDIVLHRTKVLGLFLVLFDNVFESMVFQKWKSR